VGQLGERVWQPPRVLLGAALKRRAPARRHETGRHACCRQSRTLRPSPLGATKGEPSSNCTQRQPEPAPERDERRCHLRVGAVGDDLDPAAMRGSIDRIQGVEAHPAPQVARPDQVGLVQVTRMLGRDERVVTPFGCRRPPPRRALAAPARVMMRSIVRFGGGSTSSFFSSKAIASAPICAHGFAAAARARRARAPRSQAQCAATPARGLAFFRSPSRPRPSRGGQPTSPPNAANDRASVRSVPAIPPPAAS
jgi:hypothetical protein